MTAALGSSTTNTETSATLDFAARVLAQQAIERVYHGHRIGGSKDFDTAVPIDVIESKVRRFLGQSRALERFWETTITAQMIDRELLRMVRDSRDPDRLWELFEALSGDPVLVRECLVRPALVDRLARNFYAYDRRLHADTRDEVERLHADILLGRIAVDASHSRRRIVDTTNHSLGSETCERTENVNGPVSTSGVRGTTQACSDGEVGMIGEIVERANEFTFRVVQERNAGRERIVVYSVPKRDPVRWWREFEAASTISVSDSNDRLPLRQAEEECEENRWRPSALAPFPHWGHVAVWTGSEMIIWGSYSSVGHSYDPATDTWSTMSTNGAAEPRQQFTALWSGTEMIIWGGWANNSYLGNGSRYNPISDTWSPISTAEHPEARREHTAVWTGTEMIVWGGRGTSAGRLNIGEKYNPVTDSWVTISAVGAPEGRFSHTAVWTGEEMIVWGGWAPDFSNSGGRYDPIADSWTPTPTADSPEGRSYHSAVWTGTEMIVWGGYIDGPVNSGGRYNPTMNTWLDSSTQENTLTVRWRPTVVWTGEEMIVWGGSGIDSNRLNTGDRYDPNTDSWISTSTQTAPLARSYHAAVWTGELMIVWGGSTNETPGHGGNTGGRYDPSTDSWTPTSRSYLWDDELRDHSGVWTGNEFIVWGGSPYRYLGTIYNPSTGIVTSTTSVNAPERRQAHTAVWTGDQMIVWGGYRDGPLSSGGRYEPVSDTWISMPMRPDTPEDRLRHTAIWTGSEMIVWGGYGWDGSQNPFPSGGRFDPETDSWIPMSQLPDGRAWHTAIWTGSEMIVWGGRHESILRTGARYDPETDSWAPTTLSPDTPSQRYEHSAVWSGSEMIIWGGADESGELSSGGRYDPSDDDWTATATIDAPGSRQGHTAVWTGAEMIVWGGLDSSSSSSEESLSTGGRYQPRADRWESISMEGAPSSRTGHVAAWTGRSMIIWGGKDASDYDPHPYVIESGILDLPDVDWDGLCGDDDCDQFNPFCTTDCTDVDADEYCITSDCDDTNRNCTTDCVDADADGYCITTDCDDSVSTCADDCSDHDGDNLRGCAGDCDDFNGHCDTDCTDADTDGYCITTDCDDLNPYCTTDCSDSDLDGFCATDDCDDLNPNCALDCTDGDMDSYCLPEDCDDVNPHCNSDCTDADADGFCVTTDCDEFNANCTTDCTDADGDGYCITTDCDESDPTCTGIDCADSDGDGVRVCEQDCDDANPNCLTDCSDDDMDGFCGARDCDGDNPHCTWDCTDVDSDGFCVTSDCDDTLASCHIDCSDADNDGLPACNGDCDDNDPSSRLGFDEICTDGADNNCDGFVDAEDSSCSRLATRDLEFLGKDTLVWTSTGEADSYGLYRGTIPFTGMTGYNHLCEASGLADPLAVDFDLPPLGQSFYYLVAGQEQDLDADRFTGGPLGTSSNGASRPASETITCGPRVFVDPDVVLEAGNGLSWNTAYSSVSLALEHNSYRYRAIEVWVRGTVNETGVQFPEVLRPGVRLLGGFSGSEVASWERSPDLTPTVWSGSGGLMLFQASGTSVVLDGLTMRSAISGFIGAPAGRLTKLIDVTMEQITDYGVNLLVESSDPTQLIISDSTFISGGLSAIHVLAEEGLLTGEIRGCRFSNWADAAIRFDIQPQFSAEVRMDVVSNVIVGGGRGIVLRAHVDDAPATAIHSSFIGSNLIYGTSDSPLRLEASGFFDFEDGSAIVDVKPQIVGNSLVDSGGDGLACVATRTDLTIVPQLHTVRTAPEVWDNLINFNLGAGISESMDDVATNWVSDPIVVGNGLYGNALLYRDEGVVNLTSIDDINRLDEARDNFDEDPGYRNRAMQDYHLAFGTVLGYKSRMRFLANESDPGLGLSWIQPGFDSWAWRTGTYGVGFDTGAAPNAVAMLQTRIPPAAISVYTRVSFTVGDLSQINRLVLGAEYDDGFVAWLNGVEVFRSPTVPAGALDWNTEVGEHESSNSPTPDYEEYDISSTAVPALLEGENLLAVAVWNAAPSDDLVLVPRLILQRESPAVDAGHLDAPRVADQDVDGDRRTNDSDRDAIASPDVGADERW